MASKISICNQALTMLGSNLISQFSELSTEANACRALWDGVRDAVLRAHLWDCATKRVVLDPLSDAPAFGYGSAFALPGDCLRVISTTSDASYQPYSVEAGNILADASTISLLYIYRNEEPETWDAGLCDVMVAAMAAELAYPLAREQAAPMRQEYMRRLRMARQTDSQQGTVGRLPVGAVITSRSAS